eukprot:gnl/MRDRNA2_/MRDRNA2_60322_c0_seq1.p1 gnl/MRDRNA2_/MRDRNA2_60322_c0~~gnl/MRDRNA2_/MRDRNA2_60322_c0_seq1.p1  ORF type:complete len:547 (+),score=123.24 gnl/MRDRNA2_/MRDRNA2_60322_c0_seq1:294-1934(+)
MTCELTKKDFYAVLNISPVAPSAEIASAYRRAALLAHPDKGGSEEAFQLVTCAFETLACSRSRELYDQAQRNLLNDGTSSDVRKASHCGNDAGRCNGGHAVKRPAPESSPVAKKQRKLDASKSPRSRQPQCTKGNKHSRGTPEKALLTALQKLRNVLQAMCIEQRRHAISQMTFRVRQELLVFMEEQKNDAMTNLRRQHLNSMLPLENAYPDSSHADTGSDCVRSKHNVVMGMKQSEVCQRATRHKVQSFASLKSSTHCFGEASAEDGGPLAQTRISNVARQKQKVAGSAMTGIQCKKSRYKAHLHIKSFRIYTNSHATIDMAIDHQIILMQIRLAWTAAWQANPSMWEDDPEQFAILCQQVLKVHNTSQNEMGLKAFVSMEARHWLGKNCFVISPVMGLSEALAWHGKLLRARRVSWYAFRAAWIELMQCERHAQAKVRSTEGAQLYADAAYNKHQMFLMQRKMRDEAKSLARQQHREKMEYHRQVEREKREQARCARQSAKIYAVLERRLVRAVQSVERALDLKSKRDVRLRQKKTRNEQQKTD